MPLEPTAPSSQFDLMRLIALFTLLASFATAQEVEFVRIWPEWRDADSFKRISEYLGGKENTGRQTVLRSQTDNRDGFYFLVRVRNRESWFENARFVLEIITPDSAKPKVYEFPASISRGSRVFNLGLTGSDWTNEEEHPVAWKLRLMSSDDREIVSQQSFLWAIPESP